MNEIYCRMCSLEEEEHQRSFDRINQYGSDLSQAISEDKDRVTQRFETDNYIVTDDLRVIFK